MKLKPPQVNFVLDTEDQSLVPSSFKVIPYKKFGTQPSSSKTQVIAVTNGHQSAKVTAKGDKKPSRRLSVAERLLQSQTLISPTKNEVQNGKIAQVKIEDKNF